MNDLLITVLDGGEDCGYGVEVMVADMFCTSITTGACRKIELVGAEVKEGNEKLTTKMETEKDFYIPFQAGSDLGPE